MSEIETDLECRYANHINSILDFDKVKNEISQEVPSLYDHVFTQEIWIGSTESLMPYAVGGFEKASNCGDIVNIEFDEAIGSVLISHGMEGKSEDFDEFAFRAVSESCIKIEIKSILNEVYSESVIAMDIGVAEESIDDLVIASNEKEWEDKILGKVSEKFIRLAFNRVKNREDDRHES